MLMQPSQSGSVAAADPPERDGGKPKYAGVFFFGVNAQKKLYRSKSFIYTVCIG